MSSVMSRADLEAMQRGEPGRLHITISAMDPREALRRFGGPTREEQAAQMAQVALGHTEHCAARIAFGDGACECGKGVRP